MKKVLSSAAVSTDEKALEKYQGKQPMSQDSRSVCLMGVFPSVPVQKPTRAHLDFMKHNMKNRPNNVNSIPHTIKS